MDNAQLLEILNDYKSGDISQKKAVQLLSKLYGNSEPAPKQQQAPKEKNMFKEKVNSNLALRKKSEKKYNSYGSSCSSGGCGSSGLSDVCGSSSKC